jgi:diguanylate cyclase (GGDEF)-like protein/PAS domain S-box-containing protein
MFNDEPPPEAPFDETRLATLYASLVEDAFDFMVAIDDQFVVRFASAGVEPRLGRPPAAMTGRPAAEFVHPDDVERALLLLEGAQKLGAPGGTNSFRFLLADGQYRPYDVTAARVTDGYQHYLAVYCRPVDYQQATEQVLAQLLNGGTRADALRPVLDVFSWEVNGSSVAIAWYEPGIGHQFVSTGLPRELTGALDDPGHSWAKARATNEPVLDLDQSQLEPRLARLAALLGRGGYWVVPVPDAGTGIPALVTVWSRREIRRPDGHAYGMSMAHAYIELILRWTHTLSALNAAVLQDSLTGLANRKALFDLLEAGETEGALLFCDLDRFKPVNDRYGHAAGDRVLRQIAQRIRAAVREDDLVARAGGDEFVVVARDATPEQVAALAQRIRSAVAEPTRVGDDGDNDDEVIVGVTIGVAHAEGALDESTLAGADEALMAAKAHGRGTVRWAPGHPPTDPERDTGSDQHL